MGRRLLVTSNCQTGGLAAALRVIFPHDEIEPLPIQNFKKVEEEHALADKLAAADVWISTGRWELVDRWHIAERRPGFRLVRIPALYFDAFHPDVCYVRNAVTRRHTKNEYSSAIVAWGYAHSVAMQDVAGVFNERTFDLLGYLDRWDSAAAEQQKLFAAAGMKPEFSGYLRSVKRGGIFMHSQNHPKAATIMRLAKTAAVHLGADASLYDRQLDMPDGLMHQTWPVYPEIAAAYSLPGTGYLWKLGGTKLVAGLREYIQFAYSSYEQENLAPQDVVFDDPELKAALDKVLGTELGLSDV